MKTIALRVSRVLVWLLYAWLVITVVLLVLAFFLLLFGANPDAGFVSWVYRSVQRAMAPFRGMFEPISLSGQSVLDVSVLFAIIVYGIVVLALSAGLDWLTARLHAAERADEAAAVPSAGRVLQLAGAGASATAALTAYSGGTYVDLTVTGLDPAQTYDVWLESADGSRSSAGTFQPGNPGTVRVSLAGPVALRDCRMFGVATAPRPGEAAGVDVLATRVA
jgi:hypothetical protein